ncbi:unnamed protein product [Cylicostephanus goldi]|uniref:Uncharacterized protein n=1 Tax=Cylicostephanus goldi TaxID=71465 RepID=A0A3P6RV04_CYLGO|nr:unnamed protein product [Cylicostephanus goldi]
MVMFSWCWSSRRSGPGTVDKLQTVEGAGYQILQKRYRDRSYNHSGATRAFTARCSRSSSILEQNSTTCKTDTKDNSQRTVRSDADSPAAIA